MQRRRYSLPSACERALKEQLEAADERIAQLLADRTGATAIAALEARVKGLEAALAEQGSTINSLKARCGNLSDKNKALKAECSVLKKANRALGWDVEVAHLEYAECARKLKATEKRRFEYAQLSRQLTDKLSVLRAESAKMKAKLNRSPANSSLSPSSCPDKKAVHNSRVKTGKSPGGQPGHDGHRRRQLMPDEVVKVPAPAACPGCGGPLVPVGEAKRRTLIELVVTTHTTEYVSHDCVCSACNQVALAAFPALVVNEANYGNSVRAALSFLVNACNVSIDNATGFLWEATGHALKVSKGFAHNCLVSFSDKAAKELGAMKSRLAASPVMGSDATYTSASGKRTYTYICTGGADAYYWPSAVKGIAPLVSSPVDGYLGVTVHDHDISYYGFGSGHAECNAHILRYLKGVCENEPGKKWACAMRALLCEAKDAACAARAPNAAALDPKAVAALEARFDAIVAQGEAEYAKDPPVPAKYAPEGIALLARLKAYRDNHLLFLHDLSVPFDNNASERNLRGVKKKVKQTGGFRSLEHGQAYFCDFLSVVQSARARGMEVLGVVRDVFDGEQGLLDAHDATSKAAGP